MWNALDVGGKKSFARAGKGNVWKGFFESLDADLAQGRREEKRRIRRNGRKRRGEKHAS